MPEQITTPLELDALPVGTVLADDGMHPFWRDRALGWCSANGTRGIEADVAIRDGGPFTVLSRPDQSPRTEAQIKAEALREAAEEIPGVFTRCTGNNPAAWLRARAARIESGLS